MPRVKYVGPADAVDVPGVGSVKRGSALDVPAAVARSLVEQADWQAVRPPKPSKPKSPRKSAADKNGE